MNSRVAIALTALPFATTAGSPPMHAVPVKEACSLLTPAQVSAAFGVASVEAKQVGPTACKWSQGGRGTMLDVLGPIGTATPVQWFETIKSPCPSVPTR